MRLTVVIPAYQAAATLTAQLDALTHQPLGGGVEVLVCDNGSTDGTRDLVESYRAGPTCVRWVDASERRGPSFARNLGAAEASASALAFCDADDVVGDEWVAAMAEGIARDRFVTGPVDVHRLNPPWLVEGRGEWLEAPRVPVYADMLPFAIGCNTGVARDAFLAAGGFDETLTVGEDIDLALRLRAVTGPPSWRPGAIVHYRLRGDLRSCWRQGMAYGGAHRELVRRLNASGFPASSPVRVTRNLLWLARRLPLLRSRAGRIRWLWIASRLVGSLRSPATP